MKRRVRYWIAWKLLELARWVHPYQKDPQAKVWQVIEVPRRISETEAAELAAMIENL